MCGMQHVNGAGGGLFPLPIPDATSKSSVKSMAFVPIGIGTHLFATFAFGQYVYMHFLIFGILALVS